MPRFPLERLAHLLFDSRQFVVHSDSTSTALEHPSVVLLPSASAKLFDHPKAAACIDQLVPKRDRHFAIGTLNSPGSDERFSFPSKSGYRRHALRSFGNLESVRQHLVFVVQRATWTHK